MQHIVVDLEATCWQKETIPRSLRGDMRKRMEIIEIGAVRLTHDFQVVDEFVSFVRPIEVKQLSDFCMQLTSIGQDDVDAAPTFPKVFPRFLDWIGPEPYRFCTWGNYDVDQFRRDCKRHSVKFPEPFETEHVNVRQVFSAWKQKNVDNLRQALGMLDLTFEGTLHRGIDDARNIARIVQHLPMLRQQGEDPAANG